MALFNEIQVGRLNAILHKLLDMKDGAPAPQLAGDIVPTIVLEQDRIEWLFLGGQIPMIGNKILAAGGAGTFTNIALTNPAGSNVVCVCEGWAINVGAAATYRGTLAAGRITGGAVGTNRSRDGRYGGAIGACFVEGANGSIVSEMTALSGPYWQYRVNTNVNDRTSHQFVIPPGYTLDLEHTTTNQAMTGTFWWRERAIEPSELR